MARRCKLLTPDIKAQCRRALLAKYAKKYYWHTNASLLAQENPLVLEASITIMYYCMYGDFLLYEKMPCGAWKKKVGGNKRKRGVDRILGGYKADTYAKTQ
ncbi:hypothetical protein B0H17DRAFT_1138733 [Mycena rosella]|uniref:Uncharacterized protein n=1 Tax=Mycena rosella TaxID=1033263 RepID=A0AAD7D5V6_MYCRO|nr:hypothetical protein B0H17DRAFT_1138733 [Mycena rosella]